MTAAQSFIQGKLLMGARDGKMLTTDEINQLDWSVFDGVDLKNQSPELSNAVYLIGRQIDKLRNS
jgi:hypothetical protein